MPEIQQVPPKYLQIANDIQDRITQGELLPGAEVPSERVLATSWKVSRPTAAKALDALKNRGLVESRQGSGTYVVQTQPNEIEEQLVVLRPLDIVFPGAKSLEVLFVDVLAGPAHVTDALGMPAETAVLRRQLLVRDTDDTVAGLLTTWFPAELMKQAPLLVKSDQELVEFDTYLASTTGRQLSRGDEQLLVRLATADEREQLGLDDPAAVVESQLTVFDTKGEILQFTEAVHPSETWHIYREHPFPS